jgi:MFS family permease
MDVRKHAMLSCVLGATIVWYDFVIFGIATALVFKNLFFPDLGFWIAALVYGVGFFARPVGSAVFGYLGDRLGRKPTLVLTLIMTGITTTLVGLMPTFEQIGVWAAVGLFVLRIIQTMALGGEWAATSTIMIEYNLDSQRRGLFSGLLASGLPLATIMGTAVFAALTSFGDNFLLDGGWRIPFLFSVVLLAIGVYARLKVLETPAFQQAQKEEGPGMRELLAQHWKRVLVAIGVYQLGAAFYHGIIFFSVAWMVQHLGASRAAIMDTWFYLTFVYLAFVLFAGWLADRLGPSPLGSLRVYQIVTLAGIFLSVPIFGWVAEGWVLGPFLLGAILIGGGSWAPASALLTEIYPTRIRQFASGVSMNLGGMVGGGLVPLMNTEILSSYNNDITVLGWVFTVLSIIAFVSTFFLIPRSNTVSST